MLSTHSLIYVEFISLLRQARRSRKITQRELASRINKTQTYVSKVETGERRIDLVETAEWCVALGITFRRIMPQSISGVIGDSENNEQEEEILEDDAGGSGD